ncbi:hypothetical protein SAMN05720470_1217 [Fibrobacter sp. UWOV1]|uniref:hypothetical protein n=1 Tax=Fibrobacter sp. UWOV1 TaxID=1896215 RepID=UPI00092471C5|nr:hypothetical protein [Fibrobacter sp. UWOV1]SHL87229.1 hypothetical protein SAMN05720470_1217 [Fibrobacter sp. UWOV1]
MNRLLYPIVASALITIVPFLLTFEKGQDITRGLIGYEYFALLLLFAFVKGKVRVSSPASLRATYVAKQSMFKSLVCVVLLGVTVCALLAVAWLDLQNLLAIKGWSTGWYGVLPFVTCGLAVAMMWKVKPFSISAISFILFVALIAHLFAYNHYAAQPLAQFPVVDYMSRSAPKPVARDSLPESFRAKYFTTDSATITRGFTDSTRTNVLVLVESWGISLDTNRFAKQLQIFDGIPNQVGAHHRMYSRTRTAEREDLIYRATRDSVGHRDTVFIPQVLRAQGVKTQFIYGGDSLVQMRNKYIRNVGFDETFFGNSTNSGEDPRTDRESAAQLDSLLSVQDSALRFIAWTTLDTKFPLQSFMDPYKIDVTALNSAYTERLAGTLQLVADLAKKHPEVRFIVQGDHNPILSPLKFQEKFYKRWVPFVVLN